MNNAEELVSDLEDDNLDHMHLIFTVNTEAYGVQIEYVTEIVGLQKIVAVPDVPTFIKGVINLRGQVIPVMDVRIRFNMPTQTYDDRTVIIVLEHKDIKTGLIVDGVSDVLELNDNEISPRHAKKMQATRSSQASDKKKIRLVFYWMWSVCFMPPLTVASTAARPTTFCETTPIFEPTHTLITEARGNYDDRAKRPQHGYS